MIVIYEGPTEILVCSKESEKKLKKNWFGPRTNRDITQYRRYESEVGIISNLIMLSNSLAPFSADRLIR